jgi:YidC/Oxa1 family membrane protein insertase
VRSDAPYVYQTPYAEFERLSRPLGTRIIAINAQPLDVTDAVWEVVESGLNRVVLLLPIFVGETEVARLTKTFQLRSRAQDDSPARAFEISVTHGVKNLTEQPITFAERFNGPTTPPMEMDRGYDRQLVAGYEYERTVRIEHWYIENFTADKPSQDLTKHSSDGYPILWAGTGSIYFTAIVRPEPVDPRFPSKNGWIKVEGTLLDPQNPNTYSHKIQLAIETAAVTVGAKSQHTSALSVFFGPKKRSVLKEDYFVAFPKAYHLTLVLVSGICSLCTFQWLINVLVWMLGVFHFVVRDWGIAIIMLVLVVRMLLHPLTKKSQMSMVKMGKLAPEIERIKKKYGEDKDEMNKAMMQLYKEQGFTPVAGCLPMFIQMPIWIALWQALQSTFELRQAPFLHFFGIPLTWIYDLSQPDHLITFERTYHFLFISVSGLNVLPFLLAVVFWLQMKFTPKPPTMTPEQEQQQKIMQWMMLLFPVFLYGGPSGLNLYILASTTFGIIESKIIRSHIKRQDEIEAREGPVIVDAGPTRGSKRKSIEQKKPEPKKGGFMGWLASMQQKADQVRKDAENKPGRKPRS